MQNIYRHLTVLTLASLLPLEAQWIGQRASGIPRNQDGTPNLVSPAPRAADGMPDLTGLWRPGAGNWNYAANIFTDVDAKLVNPAADALFRSRREDLGKDDPSNFQCLPFGPRTAFSLDWMKLVQTPALVLSFFEDLTYRQIFVDGRTLPRDPNPSWMGYSAAHWDNDVLVVESNGFNDRSWLDSGGHPHTEGLHMTERYRRLDFGHLTVDVTFSDPWLTPQPWTVHFKYVLAPDDELIEYVCAENEKDYEHLVGKASDDAKDAVTVDPAILSRYVGSYEVRWPEYPGMVWIYNITLTDGKLFADSDGKNRKPLIPLSETTFSALPGTVHFIVEAGQVTRFESQSVEGTYTGVRR